MSIYKDYLIGYNNKVGYLNSEIKVDQTLASRIDTFINYCRIIANH